MSYADTILPELDHEMASTRKVLERMPEDKVDWQPHPKSHTIGWNANHLAELPGWGAVVFSGSEHDLAPPGGQRYETPRLRTRQQILELFDRNVAALRKAIVEAGDEQMSRTWSLLSGGNVIFSMPRAAVIRSFVLNHMIHHRAVLCVYYRLNGIPVPGMYGPSGDEQQ